VDKNIGMTATTNIIIEIIKAFFVDVSHAEIASERAEKLSTSTDPLQRINNNTMENRFVPEVKAMR
jgi:hypothetical protein